jgi:RimJ/RimL family protein N-acetyltransferase
MNLMIELKSSEFNNVVQVLDNERMHYTFAYAVVEGKQPGRIYADNNIEPTCCLIVCKSGKYLVAGDTNNTGFNEFLSDYLYDRENHSNYFDLYSSSQKWIFKLDELLADNVAKLSRQLFRWNYLRLSSIPNFSEMLPEGFELKRMDADLFVKYSKEIDSSYINLWGSPNNFVSNGFGFCIMKDNEFVSICNTYYVRQGFAEIDIITKEQFRKQGFALITCSEFIKHCVNNNIKPIWDCDDGNERSKALAEKLGFQSVETYQMHWWHENKSFVENYLKKFNYQTN